VIAFADPLDNLTHHGMVQPIMAADGGHTVAKLQIGFAVWSVFHKGARAQQCLVMYCHSRRRLISLMQKTIILRPNPYVANQTLFLKKYSQIRYSSY
jgi:hypothetical protein